MPLVTIPDDLNRYSDGQTKFELEGETVGEVLSGLFRRFPDLQKRIVSESGQLFSYLPVFVDGEKLPTTNYQGVKIASNGSLEVVLIASGG